MITTEQIIQAAVAKFAAPRGERVISTSARTMRVHTPGERVLYLPNGACVKITTDASGVATQVEEDDALHAVVRPKPVNLREQLLRRR